MRGGSSKPVERKAYAAEVDTNIYQISLSNLKNAAEMATGDAELCSKCQAVFNNISKIETKKDLEGNE